MKKSLTYLVIGSVTFSLLLTEIMLNAIFQVMIGAMNTVMAIAVALVGLASAGIVVYVWPRLRGQAMEAGVISKLLFAVILAELLLPVLLMQLPVNHGEFTYSLNARTTLYLLLIQLISVIPFFIGGLLINILLYHKAEDVSRLYFADLCGAGFGCLAATACFERFSAPASIMLSTLPAMLVLLLWPLPHLRGRIAAAVLPVLLVGLLLIAGRTPLLDIKQFSTMGEVRAPAYRSFNVREGDVDFQSWALDAWTVIRNPRIPQQWENFKGWGLSPTYTGHVPDLRLVNFNMRFSTYATGFDGDLEALRPWLDADLISLQYLMGRSYEKVLIIGAGGGREVLNALNHDAKDITAIDISNVVVNDIMKGQLRDFSGRLYEHPRVHAQVDEGRSFIRRQTGKFDLIDFTIVGGANVEKLEMLRQEDLFTVEAMADYLEHLNPDGVLSYVMYSTRNDVLDELRGQKSLITPPYIPAVQTLTGLKQIVERRGAGRRFGEHVLVSALPGVIDPNFELVHIIVSNRPFTQSEREQFTRVCGQLQFPVMFPSQTEGGNIYADIISAPDVEQFDRKLPFTTRPPTDERPFLYAFEPRHYFASFPQNIRALSANPVAQKTFLLLFVTIIFLLGPSLFYTPSSEAGPVHGIVSKLLYFACLGMAYMILEMAVILKLNLYLGKPVYGLSVGLFAFLMASGLGSLAASSFSRQRTVRTGTLVTAFIIFYAVCVHLFWPSLFASTMELPTLQRCVIAVLILFPLAFPMGMLFPLAMRSIAGDDRRSIPWFWAVNGITSVLGLMLTRSLALTFGLTVAGLVALGAYAVAACCLRGFAPRKIST
jgi:hypothetical protein